MIKDILFVVNANHKIGMGHLYRSLNIANEFVLQKWRVTFITPDSKLIKKIIETSDNESNQIKTIALEFNQLTEAETIKIFSKVLEGFQALVFDLLEPDLNKFQSIKNYNQDIKICSIASFKYSFDKRFEDIFIFPGLEKLNQKKISHNHGITSIYSGEKYITFRKEFRAEFKQREFEKSKVVLISMGGSDPYDFTIMALNGLENHNEVLKIYAVIGIAAKSYKDISKYKSKHEIIILNNVKNISKYMYNSEVSIINGGLTRYELCITQTPFIAISIHQVQFNITKLLTDKIGAINLGVSEILTTSDILNAYQKLTSNPLKWNQISHSMNGFFDAKGIHRIYCLINNLVSEGEKVE